MAHPTYTELRYLAQETGYQEDALEIMLRLSSILQAIVQDEFLRDRLAIKGGTDLNAFHLNLNRPSLDIDLAARDLYDVRSIVAKWDEMNMDMESVRSAFIAAVTASREGWKDRRIDSRGADPYREYQNLERCMPRNFFRNENEGGVWFNESITICRKLFGNLLVLTPGEQRLSKAFKTEAKSMSIFSGRRPIFAPASLSGRSLPGSANGCGMTTAWSYRDADRNLAESFG